MAGQFIGGGASVTDVNAQTLDGIDSTGFLRTNHLSGRSISNPDSADTYGVSAYYLSSGATNKPTGTDHSLLTLAYSESWATQIAMDWRSKDMYFRTQENTVWKSWAKMWHSDNDGAGSGLDADTVDGFHLSDLDARYVDVTGDTMTGLLVTKSNTTAFTSANDTTLSVRGASVASMSFHKPGVYAVNFGLDSDNKMKMGGWSAGGVYHTWDFAGNYTAAGDITAYSDARLKSDVITFPNALETVSQLRGVKYTKDGKASTGVIAQEVEAVIPEVVHTADDEMGTKSVAYGNMVGLLIEAVKELNAKHDAEIAALKAEITALKGDK